MTTVYKVSRVFPGRNDHSLVLEIRVSIHSRPTVPTSHIRHGIVALAHGLVSEFAGAATLPLRRKWTSPFRGIKGQTLISPQTALVSTVYIYLCTLPGRSCAIN